MLGESAFAVQMVKVVGLKVVGSMAMRQSETSLAIEAPNFLRLKIVIKSTKFRRGFESRLRRHGRGVPNRVGGVVADVNAIVRRKYVSSQGLKDNLSLLFMVQSPVLAFPTASEGVVHVLRPEILPVYTHDRRCPQLKR